MPSGFAQVPAPPRPHMKGGSGGAFAPFRGLQTPSFTNQPQAKPPLSELYCSTQSSHVSLFEHDDVVKPDTGQSPAVDT